MDLERLELLNPGLHVDLEVGVVVLQSLTNLVATLGDDLAGAAETARRWNVQGQRQQQEKRERDHDHRMVS